MQQEVQDFVEFLLEKRVSRPKGELRLDWRGALRDLRDKYTIVSFDGDFDRTERGRQAPGALLS